MAAADDRHDEQRGAFARGLGQDADAEREDGREHDCEWKKPRSNDPASAAGPPIQKH